MKLPYSVVIEEFLMEFVFVDFWFLDYDHLDGCGYEDRCDSWANYHSIASSV